MATRAEAKSYFMEKIEKEIVIVSGQGLHARPAAMFVQIAQKYDSEITVSNESEKVNGKSIMGILMLGAQKGSKITIAVEGADAAPAMQELEEFLSKDE